MKKLLNTLFVTTQGAYLHKEGESIIVKVQGEVKLRLPIHTLDGIVCFGNVLCSPFLLGFCAEKNVEVSMLTERGRFLARVEGACSGNVLLRRQHYRLADDLDVSATVSSAIVCAKLANSRTVLQRALRDHKGKVDEPALDSAIKRLSQYIRKIGSNGLGVEEVRGYEGESARRYFGVFNHLLVAQKSDFAFHERSRRPPMDEVNALLSFLYTLLLHDISSACAAVGLDRAVGFLHRDRPGRPGLALDMMEEFRAFIADRLAISLINLKQIQKRGFEKTETGAVMMDDETRKTVLVAYQKRKQDEIAHPYTGESIPLGLVFHIQALLMARYIRGDLDGYPPFIWK